MPLNILFNQGSQTSGSRAAFGLSRWFCGASAHFKNRQNDELKSNLTQFKGFFLVLWPAKAFPIKLRYVEHFSFGMWPFKLQIIKAKKITEELKCFLCHMVHDMMKKCHVI